MGMNKRKSPYHYVTGEAPGIRFTRHMKNRFVSLGDVTEYLCIILALGNDYLCEVTNQERTRSDWTVCQNMPYSAASVLAHGKSGYE